MRLDVVTTIAAKELLESFRDRRTLFLMIFLPILLYPVLILVVTQVASLQQTKLAEQTSVVVFVNATADHPLVTFLEADDRFQLVDALTDPAPSLREETAQAVIDLAPSRPLPNMEQLRVQVLFKSVDEASRQALDRIEEALNQYASLETERRLRAFGIEAQAFDPIIRPLDVTFTDESPPEQRGGYTLGAILPILVIATVLLGAYYPAVDLTAGEKERGSIQTLFTAPITPFEIVSGKYVAVLGIALVSGMANLLSMALIFSQNLFLAEHAPGGLDFSISPSVLAALFVVIVLIAILFSAVLLTVAVLARSYKEGQAYIGPVYIACFVPAMIAQMPGFELTTELAMIPAVNVALLMKQLLVDGIVLESMFLVASSTLVFTTLVLVIASKLFAQEAIILGERGNLALLVRRTGSRSLRRPTIGEGLSLYGVVFVLLFYVGALLQNQNLHWGLLGTLFGLVLLPAVLLTLYLRLDLKETFHLQRPPLRGLGAAAILGSSAWILVAWLNSLIEAHWLPTPPELAETLEGLIPANDDIAGWAALLAVVAFSPALCEELLFRGFLFSSLRQRVKPWVLIGLTALLFGLLHLNLYRLFGTTALGVLLGLLVYKSGSIWTAILFHALSNGIVLLMVPRLGGPDAAEATLPGWLLAVGAIGTLLGLALLFSLPSPWAHATLPTPAPKH